MNEQEIQTKAKELIELKREIKLLLTKEQELKTDFMPIIKEKGVIEFDFGRVFYRESKGSESFSRKSVLQYLRDSYGHALADQVDKDCTKKGEPRKTVYIAVKGL